MADHVLSGGDALMKKLREIAESMGGGSVSVGFMEGSTYPDGTPVAAVAFWNEYGVPENNQPPRPFFRGMIAEESPHWGESMAALAKSTNYDGPKVLDIMGQTIAGALEESIDDFMAPGNAESTIARKGFDKPLIDTGNMKRAIDWKVE